MAPPLTAADAQAWRRLRERRTAAHGEAGTIAGTLADALEARAPEAAALMEGAGRALREEAKAAAGRATRREEAEAARGSQSIRDAFNEAHDDAGGGALIYRPGIEPLAAEAARLLATPWLSGDDRRYLEQFRAVIESEIRVRDMMRDAIGRARA